MGRRYPAHLVFALHVHAAAFVARAIAAAASIAVPAWGEPLSQTATLYAVVYLFLALRTAYGTSRRRASFHIVVLSVVYVVAIVVVTALAVGLAVVGPHGLPKLVD